LAFHAAAALGGEGEGILALAWIGRTVPLSRTELVKADSNLDERLSKV